MAFDWRQHDSAALEPHFNPRVAIGEQSALKLIAGFTERSARARETLEGEYGIRYGERPKMTLDFHPATRSGSGSPPPPLFFIHGGFWRALDKDDHSFVAPGFVEAGIAVANVNYDLCPSVSVDDIVREIREAFAFVYAHAAEWGADPNRIVIAGHSAGAHLCAMLMSHDWPRAGLPADAIKACAAISGIYEPGAVQRISVQNDVRLTDESAARNDAIAHPPLVGCPVLAPVGGDEPEGWQQQTHAFAAVCPNAEVLIVPGANHFTVVDACVTPGNEAFDRIVALARAA